MNIGKKIKELRESKEMSQSKLAEAVGLSVHTVSKYEQGQREPNLATINKIADALGVEVHEIVSTRPWIEAFSGNGSTFSFLDVEQQKSLMDNLDRNKTTGDIYYRTDQLLSVYGYKIAGDDSEGYLYVEGNGIKFPVSDEDIKELERNIGFALKIKLEELMNKNLKEGE